MPGKRTNVVTPEIVREFIEKLYPEQIDVYFNFAGKVLLEHAPAGHTKKSRRTSNPTAFL